MTAPEDGPIAPARHGSATFTAIGTQVSVLTVEAGGIARAERRLRSELSALDMACSRFHESELQRVQDRGGAWSTISPLLTHLLEAALEVARFTDGAVDPTVGAAMSALGYDVDFKAVRANDPRPRLAPPRGAPGWELVELDLERHRVRIPRGVELDLGSSAKAWMADRAAHSIAGQLTCGVLVNLGGDIGTCGEPPPQGWQVGIDTAARTATDDVSLVVALHGGGLASSGTRVRSWTRGGERLHHIVDPRTGDVAPSAWALATVAAPSCLTANAASTAAIVMGRSATEWLGRLGLPCRLLGEDGTVTCVGGWPEDPISHADPAHD